MRILITGGLGFLGHHIVEHFLKTTDAELVVLDKMSYASAGFDRLRDIKAFDDKRVHVLGCNLEQPVPEGVRAEVGAVDYVIHAAAETHVDNSIVDPLPFLKSNVIGTHHLLWWMRDYAPSKLRRVFVVSTDEVYGPASWESPGNVETDPFRPANPYAAAKVGEEAVAMAYANTYRLPITIVNTMNLYGERQGAEKFIPLVIRKMLANEPVTIHADPTRTRSGTRFYIHCRNYASAIAFLIEREGKYELVRKNAAHPAVVTQAMRAEAERGLPLKIHVAGEREISNLELAKMIASVVKEKRQQTLPLKWELVDFHSSRPGHDLRYALDDSAIRAGGWKQPVDTEASLKKTVEWYLDNPRWLDIGRKDNTK